MEVGNNFWDFPFTKTAWSHLVIVYDAESRIVRAYANGIEVGRFGGFRPNRTETGFHLGTDRNASGKWYSGIIDDVAAWNRALAPAEIALLSGAVGQYRRRVIP